MAAPQTTVAATMTRGFPGMMVDTSDVKSTRSYVSAESSAEIPFGQMLKQGSTDDTALRLTAATDVNKLIGILVHSHAYAQDQELGTTGLKPKTTLGVLDKGVIWV